MTKSIDENETLLTMADAIEQDFIQTDEIITLIHNQEDKNE